MKKLTDNELEVIETEVLQKLECLRKDDDVDTYVFVRGASQNPLGAHSVTIHSYINSTAEFSNFIDELSEILRAIIAKITDQAIAAGVAKDFEDVFPGVLPPREPEDKDKIEIPEGYFYLNKLGEA